MSSLSTRSIYILIAIISLTAFIGAIFWLVKSPMINGPETGTPVQIGEKNNKEYQIAIYYFPSKKNDADALGYFFKQHGYSIAVHKAATIPALKSSKNTPNHIFFNRSEFDKAMKIKAMIEKVLGHTVNAYRFHEQQQNPSMMMVFTEK